MMRVFVLRDELRLKVFGAFLKSNWLAFAQSGKPLQVTVSEHKSKRTLDQNRLYWSLLQQIAEQAWTEGKQFPAEAWHDYLRGKYIGWQDLPHGGRTPISTTTLDVAAFSEYVTKIQAFAANELGLELI